MLDDALGEHLKKRSKKKHEPDEQRDDEDVSYSDAVLVCSKASVISIGKNHSGLTGMVTFDISKDPRIPVAIDGMIKIHADGIHETSQVKGKSESEQGSLVLRSGYLHRAAKKGWI